MSCSAMNCLCLLESRNSILKIGSNSCSTILSLYSREWAPPPPLNPSPTQPYPITDHNIHGWVIFTTMITSLTLRSNRSPLRPLHCRQHSRPRTSIHDPRRVRNAACWFTKGRWIFCNSNCSSAWYDGHTGLANGSNRFLWCLFCSFCGREGLRGTSEDGWKVLAGMMFWFCVLLMMALCNEGYVRLIDGWWVHYIGWHTRAKWRSVYTTTLWTSL